MNANCTGIVFAATFAHVYHIRLQGKLVKAEIGCLANNCAIPQIFRRKELKSEKKIVIAPKQKLFKFQHKHNNIDCIEKTCS